MLKAYMVHDGEPSENAVLVFAKSAQEARRIGNNWSDIGSDGFLTIRAVRIGSVDSLARQSDSGYVEHSDEILRKAGWRCECDDTCGHCGLAEMDGKYPVCEECDSCPDCGHDEDCPNKGASTGDEHAFNE